MINLLTTIIALNSFFILLQPNHYQLKLNSNDALSDYSDYGISFEVFAQGYNDYGTPSILTHVIVEFKVNAPKIGIKPFWSCISFDLPDNQLKYKKTNSVRLFSIPSDTITVLLPDFKYDGWVTFSGFKNETRNHEINVDILLPDIVDSDGSVLIKQRKVKFFGVNQNYDQVD